MPWKKGESGNPRGRPKGAKDSLAQAYVRAIGRIWEKKGEEVLERLVDEDPATFARLVGALMPKDYMIKQQEPWEIIFRWKGKDEQVEGS